MYINRCRFSKASKRVDITYCIFQAKKAPIIPIPSKLPLLLPKDTNVMNLVHSLTPTVGVDQSLMPPPPMQDTAADESTNKKPKYKGIIMSLRI